MTISHCRLLGNWVEKVTFRRSEAQTYESSVRPARTQIPSCLASELSFRLPCPSLTSQTQKEFGAPCRGERGCNSWPLFLSHSPAWDFYSTWLIRCRAGPHTYFF